MQLVTGSRGTIPSRKWESFAKEQLIQVQQVLEKQQQITLLFTSDSSCSTPTSCKAGSGGLALAVPLSQAFGQEWTCLVTRVYTGCGSLWTGLLYLQADFSCYHCGVVWKQGVWLSAQPSIMATQRLPQGGHLALSFSLQAKRWLYQFS